MNVVLLDELLPAGWNLQNKCVQSSLIRISKTGDPSTQSQQFQVIRGLRAPMEEGCLSTAFEESAEQTNRKQLQNKRDEVIILRKEQLTKETTHLFLLSVDDTLKSAWDNKNYIKTRFSHNTEAGIISPGLKKAYL